MKTVGRWSSTGVGLWQVGFGLEKNLIVLSKVPNVIYFVMYNLHLNIKAQHIIYFRSETTW